MPRLKKPAPEPSTNGVHETNGHAPPAAEATYLPAVPLGQLRACPLNPRKSFDEVELAELAESIRSKGVLEPLLIRPRPLGKSGEDECIKLGILDRLPNDSY